MFSIRFYRHPYPPFNIHYRYRFHAPHHDTYEVSWVSFTTEKLENYNWNYLDHYICTRGHTDFALVEVYIDAYDNNNDAEHIIFTYFN